MKDKSLLNVKTRQKKKLQEQQAAKEAFKAQLRRNENMVNNQPSGDDRKHRTQILMGSEEIEFQKSLRLLQE